MRSLGDNETFSVPFSLVTLKTGVTIKTGNTESPRLEVLDHDFSVTSENGTESVSLSPSDLVRSCYLFRLGHRVAVSPGIPYRIVNTFGNNKNLSKMVYNWVSRRKKALKIIL